MRIFFIFILCWVSIGLWFCWDDLAAWFTSGSLFTLSVFLSFVYPLVPLVPALLTAVASSRVFRFEWWLRAPLAATVSGGIVLIFLTQTQQFTIPPVLFFTAIGFVLGCLATRPKLGHETGHC
jgi:hypothetical protein